MLNAFFERLNAKITDLNASAALWDRRADEVNDFTVEADDFAMKLLDAHQSWQGQRVLDIGCGAGRFLLEFGRRGAALAGVEISPKMAAHAQAKLAAAGYADAELHTSAWEQLDVQELGWEQAFDLTFLYMSPAISSAAMLAKAMQVSRGAVFVAAYSQRHDSLLEQLQVDMGQPVGWPGERGLMLPHTLWNIWHLQGYFPDIAFEHRERQLRFTPETMLERYASWMLKGPDDTPAQRQRLLAAMQARSIDGELTSTMRDVIAHLYLDTRQQGAPR